MNQASKIKAHSHPVARAVHRKQPAARPQAPRLRKKRRRPLCTLGDLIAAAFDALGNESSSVKRVLSAAGVATPSGRKIVFV